MKVSVGCRIYYTFEAEIADTTNGKPNSVEDTVFLSDCEDPVYPQLIKIFHDNRIDYDGAITSIINTDTGEEIWVE